jgi:Asp-tRNA(Asn)/Glu-tRNA(Gln) amidotransferase C subunit
MKNSKKIPTQKDLENIHEDINEILNLIDSLDEIDEDYSATTLDKKVEKMQKELNKKYKDFLPKENLDSKK